MTEELAESQEDHPLALWVANTRQPEKKVYACRWAVPSFTGPNALRGTAAATDAMTLQLR